MLLSIVIQRKQLEQQVFVRETYCKWQTGMSTSLVRQGGRLAGLFGDLSPKPKNGGALLAIEIKVLASGSSGNCYLINSEIMIECGITIDRIRKGSGFKLGEIEACLISHEH
jgi:hypothetical protein